jgi:hypothetical protein
MTSGWVTLVRWVLHHDTFELFVAPAVADFHHAPSLAARSAIATSFAGALLHDLSDDMSAVMSDISLMLGLMVIQASYYGAMLLILAAHLRIDDALAHLANGGGPQVSATVLGLMAISTLPTLLCFWPPRRTPDI